jgi:PAS domain S-box-containing protein
MTQTVAWVLVVIGGVAVGWLVVRLRSADRLADSRLVEREAALRTARAFQTIVEQASNGLVLLDVGGRVVAINQAVRDLTGAPRVGLEGEEFWTAAIWSAESTREAVKRGCAEALAGRRNRLEIGSSVVESGQVELSFHPLLDEGGVFSQVFVEARSVPPTSTRSDHRDFGLIGSLDREIERLTAFSRQPDDSFDLRTGCGIHPTIRAAVMEAMATVRQNVPPIEIDVDLGAAARSTSSVPALAVRMVVCHVIQDFIEASGPDGVVAVRADVVEDAVVVKVSDRCPPAGAQGPRKAVRRAPNLGLPMLRRFAETVGVRYDVSSGRDGTSAVIIRLPLATSEPSGEPAWSRPARLQ